MKLFLDDYETGLSEKRYVYHELPVGDNYYDIGLSFYFLLMYTSLGYDFHIKAMSEMLRVCLIHSVIDYYKKRYFVELKETDYLFQKGANSMLFIRK